VLATTATPAAAKPRIFTLSDPRGRLDAPASIAAGPHHRMWVASWAPLNTGGKPRYAVGRVDLGGRWKLFFTRADTYGIAVVRGGTVFATEPHASRVVRIAGRKVTELPTPTRHAEPRAIAAGPDGNAWFVETEVEKIARVTPGGAITEFPVPPLPYLGSTIPA
jgi:virginiamycin B lyase